MGLTERSDRDIWYLDSGSQSHTVNNDAGFISLRQAESVTLESAAGDDINVEGIGSYRIRSRPDLVLELRECIYAPSLIANFLSSGKLNQNGMDVLLRKDGVCLVYDGDDIVATGQLKNGMYVMNFSETANFSGKNVVAAQTKKMRSLIYWHKTLNLLNAGDLKLLLKKLDIKTEDEDFECKTCLLAKMTRSSHKPQEIKSKRPLDLIYTDLSRIIRTPSSGNYKYFLSFVDDYSRYSTVYLLKSKEEVCEKFDHFKAFVENKFERKIKELRSDNGTEYTNDRFQKIITESGINHERTQIKTPQQNGVAERLNRTIGNGVRSALIGSGLPSRYWPQAVKHVVQMRNVSPNSAIDNQIPYELWHERCANYDDFHHFGCTAIVYNEEATAKLADPKGIECRLLCLSSNKKGYVLLSVFDGRLIESGNVTFMKENINETIPQSHSGDQTNCFEIEWESNELSYSNNLIVYPETVPQSFECNEPTLEDFDASVHINQQPCVEESSDPAGESHSELSINDETEIDHSIVNRTQESVVQFSMKELQQFVNENPEATVRALPGKPTFDKSNRGRPTKKYRYKISYIAPDKIVDDALTSEESDKWKCAMDKEYDALIKNNTWTLTELPTNVKPIKTRWVLNK